jgi:protein-S-isoprenylcysteine O-methyltransferase Ste14
VSIAKRGFLARHGIVRNDIRKDILYFALPAILIFATGLIVSNLDSSRGLFFTIENMIGEPQMFPEFSIQNIVGIALIVLGFSVEIISQITLGRNYSSTLVIREDHQLITHGIYNFVRHPLYLGVILISLGFPIFSSSLFGLLVMLAMIPVFLIRIKLEERLLVEEFGNVYREYMQRTCKLFPFIY